MFVEGYEHGKAYSEMELCIHVGILDFIQMESPGFHHKILLLDKETYEVYSRKFLFQEIELKKLDETPESEQNELYRWARLIAANNWKEICEEAVGIPYMEEMKKISQDEKERYLYLREAMALSDEASRIKTAKNEGIKEGIKEGKKEGIRKMLEAYWR